MNPARSESIRAVSITHLCSIELIRMRFRSGGARRANPVSARLLASVAPDVKTISSASAPIKRATEVDDFSTACAALQPIM